MKTFLFYDIETTGLNKCFDQVLQFAAIRTDKDLKEIERHEIKIKPRSDVIPSPYATITHYIGLNDTNEGLSEYEAIKKIHALMNTPGTISLGYNTLGFDDEFLRFNFYKNLLTPYTHQYANQCSRMDIYPMTIMYYLYKNKVIDWPVNNDRVSLKLENINTANQLAKGQAHDAMVDVIATVELAKKLKQESSMWDYLTANFAKNTDQQRQMQLPKTIGYCREGILTSGNLGYRNNFQAPVIGLGSHELYKNQTLWLRLDLPELQEATLENFQEKTWVINKKLGEAELILPPTDRFLEKLDKDRLNIAEENKKWLTKNPELLEKISRHYAQYTYPIVPEIDIDAALYSNDFWTNDDQADCREFHQADNKALSINLFRNPDLKRIALRLVGRNFPEQLNAEQQAEFTQHIDQVFSDTPPIDFKGTQQYGLQQLQEDLKKIPTERELDQKQQALLAEYQQHFIPPSQTGTP